MIRKKGARRGGATNYPGNSSRSALEGQIALGAKVAEKEEKKSRAPVGVFWHSHFARVAQDSRELVAGERERAGMRNFGMEPYMKPDPSRGKERKRARSWYRQTK